MSYRWKTDIWELAFSYLGDAGSSKGHNDSDHIDSELELKELGDAVVNVSTPHHSLHYTAKVIIR